MNPQELRLGNYVSDKDGKIFQVKELFDADIAAQRGTSEMKHDYFSPIELNAEWLMKFGCSQTTSMKSHWSNGDIDFIFDKEYNRVLISIGNRMRFLNFVHEFQNYFYLTGTELSPHLTIKLLNL